MRTGIKRTLLLTICLLGSLVTYAQKYSNEFLAIGVGARAFGMGGAVGATVSDVNSGYWNPAGLLQMKDNLQVSLMHSEYFAGIANYDYGAVGIRQGDKSAMSFSIIRFGIDDIPNTLDLYKNGQINYNNIKSFSAVDYAFIGSYARKIKIEGLSLGGSVKIINRKVGSFAHAWGFGLDFGAQYRYKSWQLGAMMRDVTSTFNAWTYTFTESEKQVLQSTGNIIPNNTLEITRPRLCVSAGRKFTVYKKISCLAETDWNFTSDGQRNVLVSSKVFNLDPAIGAEFAWEDFVFIRTGANNFQRETDIDGKRKLRFQPSVGAGLRLRSLTIDYAFTTISGQSAALYSNVFSLKLAINKRNTAPAAQ
jgi:hypothetical protein